MNYFILDAALAFRWLLTPQLLPQAKYARSVLESLNEYHALVPGSFHLELTNLILHAERKKMLELHHSKRFLEQIKKLPIFVDNPSIEEMTQQTIELARAYSISNYEAAYLSLALRKNCPIATLEVETIKRIKQLGIEHYKQGI